MKLSVITNEKDTLEFYMEGERYTVANYLKEKISLMDGVDFCAYKLDHPLDNRARFILKAKNPKKALNEAIKQAREEISEFKSTVEKIK
ncbi:MAG: RpoL/Rpb11 RNA polymerase subunit family protein [Candidatus ainarchaeum sp.]|jgi:DNA-directed RNA polymerase subunit L|nr:RpoL/Rpb11 RNA polymerase subunit family protein [Candidatus ainarchaeum sp.]MDD3086003.1 RpoL/Rpb11 RNA polymerase subunit family protein [Candidatus ainarchaeum sp.]MDD4128638.1 RpoL/Rpb11 RNA polymerase subunit family protein [Candidatus ainarchaeum sp.]MDD4467964.1 RpoL/Rpb11 RNA polymerase subunit family protein [Candidatus ainarchaeum sp.]HPM85853.1 RpoL/Rpb11 RNA polymerase subunit family protein [archaeon]